MGLDWGFAYGILPLLGGTAVSAFIALWANENVRLEWLWKAICWPFGTVAFIGLAIIGLLILFNLFGWIPLMIWVWLN